ncbi:28S ribosomal protein S15-like [Sarcoptes scabiei]|nr:28S ribosomal protein S15-like [Sarcoptes scabiei]
MFFIKRLAKRNRIKFNYLETVHYFCSSLDRMLYRFSCKSSNVFCKSFKKFQTKNKMIFFPIVNDSNGIDNICYKQNVEKKKNNIKKTKTNEMIPSQYENFSMFIKSFIQSLFFSSSTPLFVLI